MELTRSEGEDWADGPEYQSRRPAGRFTSRCPGYRRFCLLVLRHSLARPVPFNCQTQMTTFWRLGRMLSVIRGTIILGLHNVGELARMEYRGFVLFLGNLRVAVRLWMSGRRERTKTMMTRQDGALCLLLRTQCHDDEEAILEQVEQVWVKGRCCRGHSRSRGNSGGTIMGWGPSTYQRTRRVSLTPKLPKLSTSRLQLATPLRGRGVRPASAISRGATRAADWWTGRRSSHRHVQRRANLG